MSHKKILSISTLVFSYAFLLFSSLQVKGIDPQRKMAAEVKAFEAPGSTMSAHLGPQHRQAAVVYPPSNNGSKMRSSSVEPLLPDLTIIFMRITLENTSCFTLGDSLGVRVWIENMGQAVTDSFVVRVNGADQTVSKLGIGETKQVFFPGYNNPVTAIVDPLDTIIESDETNNILTEMVPVPTPPLPCATPTFTLTPSTTFTDVPATNQFWRDIESIYNAGITGGCATNPLQYCPEMNVTRAQLAVFLEKGVHCPNAFFPPNVAPTFSDTAGHWAEDWIEALRSDGITGGCGTNLYCPEDPVTRAQMAVFLLKSKYGSGFAPPVVGASTGFSDVPVTHWAAPWIKQLAAEGITGGCGTGIYCPDSPVTRAQMAMFLVKTFNLP